VRLKITLTELREILANDAEIIALRGQVVDLLASNADLKRQILDLLAGDAALQAKANEAFAKAEALEAKARAGLPKP
jgi:phage shock protein A